MRNAGVDAVPHGFRTSLQTYLAEHGYSREVAERALGHVELNQAVAAYARTDLEQRREAMEELGAGLPWPMPISC